MFWNKAEISVASVGRRCFGRFAQPTSGRYRAFRIRDLPELKGSFKQSSPGWQRTGLSSLLVHFPSVSGHSPVAFLSSPFQRVQAGICQPEDLNFNSFVMSPRKGRLRKEESVTWQSKGEKPSLPALCLFPLTHCLLTTLVLHLALHVNLHGVME